MRIILLLFISSSSYLLALDCPRARSNEKCMGECAAFLDNNSNKICDYWEKFNEANKPRKTVEKPVKENQYKIKVDKKNLSFYDRFVKYGLYWFFIIPCFAILVSERLKKNPEYLRLHKDIWNNILLLSFLLCSFSGFALYFFNLGNIKSAFFKAHLFSGVVCFFASLYHFLERYPSMFPFSRK